MFVYRQEIDGLRAIAIISVVLYHAGLRTYFSGGYAGVDVFFVISGYLITSMIDSESETGTFSLIHFYERRIRRILPALCSLIFLSSIFAYNCMLPERLKEFGETLISIICFCSNIYFWYKDDGYFARLSDYNPLVHTWSLAVEEQFYLIFPLLCYLLIKKRRYLIILLIGFAIISFSLAQWGGNLQLLSINQFQMFSQYHYAPFYLPIGRTWELLVGAFAGFYLRVNDPTKIFSQKFNQLFSLLGFILILISMIFLDNQNIPPFPNIFTLLPTGGTMLIILFGNKNTLVGYLLCIRPLRWIGLISYSAYLWHQCLLAFLRLQFYQVLDAHLILIVTGTTFLLSGFTYILIEQPFRNKNRFSQIQIFSMAGVTTLIIFFLAFFLIEIGNNRLLLIQNGRNSYLFDLQNYGNERYVNGNYKIIEKSRTFSIQSLTSKKRIALIGDSFSQDFYNMILEGKHLLGYEIRVHYISVFCQIYLGTEDRKQFIKAQNRQTCTNAFDVKNALPLIHQANIIIFASHWQMWSAQRLPMTIQLLNLTKQQQIFVLGPKHFGNVNPILYVNESIQFRIKQYQTPDVEVINVNRLLEKTISKSIFVNVLKMICTGYNQTCPLFTPDGKLISHDGKHLTKHGAYYIGNILFKNKPLNKLK